VSSQQTVNPNEVYYSPNVPLDMDRIANEVSSSEESYSVSAAVDSSSFSSVNEYSFFDEAVIYVRAGSGGQGANTYKKIGNQNGPPDGGNGGQGGNVVLDAGG
jgi:hypothetical protein